MSPGNFISCSFPIMTISAVIGQRGGDIQIERGEKGEPDRQRQGVIMSMERRKEEREKE